MTVPSHANDRRLVAIWMQRVRRRVARTSCPVHGETPARVTFRRYGNEFKLEHDGCCANLDEAVDRVMQELASG